jgi:1-deoxy-D-xylulose-5-phosphate synthase
LQAASRLRAQGVAATVVNARFVKPLDEERILSLAEEIRRFLTVEENALQGGFGSAVLELLAEKHLTRIACKRLGIPDTFVEHGTQEILRHKYGIDAEGIFQAALTLL